MTFDMRSQHQHADRVIDPATLRHSDPEPVEAGTMTVQHRVSNNHSIHFIKQAGSNRRYSVKNKPCFFSVSFSKCLPSFSFKILT
jgi:hypothetical protein